MHVRDEHVRNKETRTRLKRRFETQTKLALQEAERNRAASRQPSLNLPQASTSGSSSTPTLTGAAPGLTTSTLDPVDASEADPSIQSGPSDTDNISSFRRLVETEIERADLDQDFEDILDEINFPAAPGLSGLSPSRPKKITALFDFTTTHWVTNFGHYAIRSFDEELEIYELLDMDAEGEIDVEVDETTAQVLIG